MISRMSFSWNWKFNHFGCFFSSARPRPVCVGCHFRVKVILSAARSIPAVDEDVGGMDENQQSEKSESDVHLEQTGSEQHCLLGWLLHQVLRVFLMVCLHRRDLLPVAPSLERSRGTAARRRRPRAPSWGRTASQSDRLENWRRDAPKTL